MTDTDRFNLALSQIAGNRVTFAELTGELNEEPVLVFLARIAGARLADRCLFLSAFSFSRSDFSSEGRTRGTVRSAFSNRLYSAFFLSYRFMFKSYHNVWTA